MGRHAVNAALVLPQDGAKDHSTECARQSAVPDFASDGKALGRCRKASQASRTDVRPSLHAYGGYASQVRLKISFLGRSSTLSCSSGETDGVAERLLETFFHAVAAYRMILSALAFDLHGAHEAREAPGRFPAKLP